MFTKIYANGCSFMWGHHHNNPWLFKYFEETKDIDISIFEEKCRKTNIQKENTHYTNPNVFQPFNEYDWVRENFNYAALIAKNYQAELLNESIFGGSLNRLFRKTINYIINSNKDELKNTLFLLEIPPIGRDEFYFLNQERYCNFVSNNDNFDFIEDNNFKYTREFYEKCFDLEISAKDELSKLFILLELFKLHDIKFVFIQTNNRLHSIQKNSNKYINYDRCSEIQKVIDENSVKFFLDENIKGYHPVENYYSYDLVWWIREQKYTFKDATDGFSLDGHNSIFGSKKISEQIISYINNFIV